MQKCTSHFRVNFPCSFYTGMFIALYLGAINIKRTMSIGPVMVSMKLGTSQTSTSTDSHASGSVTFSAFPKARRRWWCELQVRVWASHSHATPGPTTMDRLTPAGSTHQTRGNKRSGPSLPTVSLHSSRQPIGGTEGG